MRNLQHVSAVDTLPVGVPVVESDYLHVVRTFGPGSYLLEHLRSWSQLHISLP